MASGGGEEEEGRGSRRRSLRASKGVWTATEESVWLARLQLLPEDDEDRTRWQSAHPREQLCAFCDREGDLVVKSCCDTVGCNARFHPSCALRHKAALADAELLAGELWDAEDPDAEQAAAAAAAASVKGVRFLCPRHGEPCLYCSCRRPYGAGGGMIECTRCKEWLHYGCIDMTTDNYADTAADFVCHLCKEEPPSEGKVMANILKERQYAVHEALAGAVNEAKATYEKMKALEPHQETGEVMEPLSKAEFQRLKASLERPGGWPMGLNILRQHYLSQVQAAEASAAAWERDGAARFPALFAPPTPAAAVKAGAGASGCGSPVVAGGAGGGEPYWTRQGKWALTAEEIEAEAEALGALVEEAKAFSWQHPAVARARACMEAAGLAARAQAAGFGVVAVEEDNAEQGRPPLLSLRALKELIPDPENGGSDAITDPVAKRRVSPLLRALVPLAQRAAEWEARAARALGEGEVEGVEACLKEYASLGVADDETAGRLRARLGVGEWWGRAAAALASGAGWDEAVEDGGNSSGSEKEGTQKAAALAALLAAPAAAAAPGEQRSLVETGLARARLVAEARALGPESSLAAIDGLLCRGEEALLAPLPPASSAVAAVVSEAWRGALEAHVLRLRRVRWRLRVTAALAPGAETTLAELEALQAEAREHGEGDASDEAEAMQGLAALVQRANGLEEPQVDRLLAAAEQLGFRYPRAKLARLIATTTKPLLPPEQHHTSAPFSIHLGGGGAGSESGGDSSPGRRKRKHPQEQEKKKAATLEPHRLLPLDAGGSGSGGSENGLSKKRKRRIEELQQEEEGAGNEDGSDGWGEGWEPMNVDDVASAAVMEESGEEGGERDPVCLADGCEKRVRRGSRTEPCCSAACLLQTAPALLRSLNAVRRSLDAAWLQQQAAGGGGGGDKKKEAKTAEGDGDRGVALPPIVAHNLLPLLPAHGDSGDGGGDDEGMRGLLEAAQRARALATETGTGARFAWQQHRQQQAKSPAPPVKKEGGKKKGGGAQSPSPQQQAQQPPAQEQEQQRRQESAMREKVRAALQEAFAKGMGRLLPGGSGGGAAAASSSAAAAAADDEQGVPNGPLLGQVLAWELEQELHRLFSSGGVLVDKGEGYRKKAASLRYNLTDAANPQLLRRVLTGEIPLAALCRMTPEELASAEAKEQGAELARKALLVREDSGDLLITKTKHGTALLHLGTGGATRKDKDEEGSESAGSEFSGAAAAAAAGGVSRQGAKGSKEKGNEKAKGKGRKKDGGGGGGSGSGGGGGSTELLQPPTCKPNRAPGEVVFRPGAAASSSASASSNSSKPAAAAPAPAPAPAPAAAKAAAGRGAAAAGGGAQQLLPPAHFIPVLPPETTPMFVEPPNFFTIEPGKNHKATQMCAYAPTVEEAEAAAALLRDGTMHAKGFTTGGRIEDVNRYLRECEGSARFHLVRLLFCEADPVSPLTRAGNGKAYTDLLRELTKREAALYFMLPPPPFPYPVPPGEEAQAARETLQLYLVPPALLTRAPAARATQDMNSRFVHGMLVFKRSQLRLTMDQAALAPPPPVPSDDEEEEEEEEEGGAAEAAGGGGDDAMVIVDDDGDVLVLSPPRTHGSGVGSPYAYGANQDDDAGALPSPPLPAPDDDQGAGGESPPLATSSPSTTSPSPRHRPAAFPSPPPVLPPPPAAPAAPPAPLTPIEQTRLRYTAEMLASRGGTDALPELVAERILPALNDLFFLEPGARGHEEFQEAFKAAMEARAPPATAAAAARPRPFQPPQQSPRHQQSPRPQRFPRTQWSSSAAGLPSLPPPIRHEPLPPTPPKRFVPSANPLPPLPSPLPPLAAPSSFSPPRGAAAAAASPSGVSPSGASGGGGGGGLSARSYSPGPPGFGSAGAGSYSPSRSFSPPRRGRAPGSSRSPSVSPSGGFAPTSTYSPPRAAEAHGSSRSSGEHRWRSRSRSRERGHDRRDSCSGRDSSRDHCHSSRSRDRSRDGERRRDRGRSRSRERHRDRHRDGHRKRHGDCDRRASSGGGGPALPPLPTSYLPPLPLPPPPPFTAASSPPLMRAPPGPSSPSSSSTSRRPLPALFPPPPSGLPPPPPARDRYDPPPLPGSQDRQRGRDRDRDRDRGRSRERRSSDGHRGRSRSRERDGGGHRRRR